MTQPAPAPGPEPRDALHGAVDAFLAAQRDLIDIERERRAGEESVPIVERATVAPGEQTQLGGATRTVMRGVIARNFGPATVAVAAGSTAGPNVGLRVPPCCELAALLPHETLTVANIGGLPASTTVEVQRLRNAPPPRLRPFGLLLWSTALGDLQPQLAASQIKMVDNPMIGATPVALWSAAGPIVLLAVGLHASVGSEITLLNDGSPVVVMHPTSTIQTVNFSTEGGIVFGETISATASPEAAFNGYLIGAELG